MAETAKLILRNKEYELPVFEGTEAEVAVDIMALRAKSGAITFDDGYGNTGACKSAITFLDGEKGILRYRGYPIDQLADGATFLETTLLLIKGELPTRMQLREFEAELARDADIPEGIHKMFEALPAETHPMAALAAAVVALSGFDRAADDAEQLPRVATGLLAKLPTIAAAWYRRSKGLAPVKPDPKLGYSANFLKMMFGTEPDPKIAAALDVLFILHADHEQNCSTSTVRIVGSSKANPYASISAGIAALWGPLHGGANQEVLEMLEAIQKDGGDVAATMAKAKDKNSGFRLMGFGHRVYKNFDPRAKIIKVHADKVLSSLGVNDPLLGIAKGLEQVALSDDYFVSRKLYPNVDFYSGIIYKAMGFPTEMFTVLFAIGRLPGWLAQFKEMRENEARIGRPRQIYTGANERALPAADKR
jgi:citrate synthase